MRNKNFSLLYMFSLEKFFKESQSTKMKEWCMNCISYTQRDLNINRCTAAKDTKAISLGPWG